MTLNLTLLTREFAICVVDRRLSAPTGGILSERGNKLTMFECDGARGFVTYNGIGSDDVGKSPNDWMADNPHLPTLPLDRFVNAIKLDANKRLARLASKGVDVRHSFVIAGFASAPFICLLSNYEDLVGEGARAKARAQLSDHWGRINGDSKSGYILLATGDFPPDRRRLVNPVLEALKIGRAPQRIRTRMTKVIRDVAYGRDRQGSVGTSVHSAILPAQGECEVSTDVVGGTTLLESPNFLSPSIMMRDIYVDVSGNPGARSRYSRVRRRALIKETKCDSCGAPVPEGYRQCGVCDKAAPLAKSM